MANTLLAVLIFAPIALTFLLKSNAALAFLTLCVGFVLSTSVIGDLKQLLSELNLSTTESTLALIILLAPPAITLLLTRKSAGHKLFFWLQLVAALGVGGLLALVAGPVLSDTAGVDVTASEFWNDLNNIQSGIIGVGGLLSLLLVWMGNFWHPRAKKHK
jgi:hypothetical protein